MLPFGPQLIGQTEKALQATLRRALAGTGLTEPQWITLRLADQNPGDLAAAVTRNHMTGPDTLIGALTDRGLLTSGQLTPAGRELLAEVGARVTALSGPIWAEVDERDAAAAARALNDVLTRVNGLLATA